MINRLSIVNIAIINKLSINFNDGLNIITGTTGSGKSIIINSISYLLGAKFNKDLIRTGSNKASIEADFVIDGHEVTLRREFTSKGTNFNYLDDRKVSLKEFRKASSDIVDMHGQHEHQHLLNDRNHIFYLDLFGNYNSTLLEYKNLFSEISNLELVLDVMIQKHKLHSEKMELYNFQLEELNRHELDDKIEEQLNTEYKLITNAKEIKQSLLNISNLLSNKSGPILNLNTSLISSNKLASIDNQFADLDNRLESIKLELEDLCCEANLLNDKINFNNDNLEIIESKIQYYEEMKRKYGGTINNVINYRKQLLIDINEADTFSSEINNSRSSIKAKKIKLEMIASKISGYRMINLKKMEALVDSHLKTMDMNNVNFKIQHKSLDILNDNGSDSINFHISTNKGEKIKPLVSVISGGELSRLMIAIKLSLNLPESINTLIFDEIDSGISGSTAEKVGVQILKLSKKYQILCISHLSQIASKGKHHFKVYKYEDGNRTYANIEKLNKRDRVDIIASLLSGKSITSESLAQAQRLLGG